MKQLTDEEYFNLADNVYKDENLQEGIVIENDDGSKWIVIESVNNKESGLQAVAVVPSEDYQAGKLDYDSVIFVSRGSEEGADWLTNFFGLGVGGKPEDLMDVQPEISKDGHQFIEYERFVDEVLKDYNIDDYSFTGHSLGGALAQYMAVLNNKYATTFAAAKAYRLLPPELQKLVDSGYYDNMIVDYRHTLDPVGHVPFGSLIGRQYTVKSGSKNFPVVGHMGKSFRGMFDAKGNILVEETLNGMIQSHEHAMLRELKEISSLRDKWQKSGAMSKNHVIFLDQAESLVVLSSVSNILSDCLNLLIQLSYQSQSELLEIWNETVNRARGIGVNLSEGEIMTALASGTATKFFMVDELQDKIDQKKMTMEKSVSVFQSTIEKISASMSDLMAFDKQLANDLKNY